MYQDNQLKHPESTFQKTLAEQATWIRLDVEIILEKVLIDSVF